MRDGKLGAGARALILRSCDLLLADAILPTRVFKNYVPRAYDNPVYQAVNLPRHYEQTIEETPVQSAAMLRRAARTQSRESTGSSQTETRGDSLTPVEEAGAHQTSPMRPLSASIEELSSDVNSSTEHERTEVKKDYVDSLRHMDTEWSMRTMDHLFNASFADFVRNDKNCDCTGRHLARIVKEFKLDQVVMGIRWLIDGWPIESTAKLLKAVFDDWLPELAALAIAQIGSSWPLRPKMGLIVAYLMMAEKVSVVALFIKSLTIGWSSGSVTELISCLDTVLEWDDKFFNEFTEVFINELIEGKDHGESNSQDPEVMVRALAAMYKTSIASTNYRILLADFRLSIAKSNYLLQYNHFVSCPQCIRQERCPFTENSFLPAPSGIVRATRNSTHELPVITNASLGNLRLALAPSILIPNSSLTNAPTSARSLPLRLGSASSSIGSIATPSILRSSSVGYQPSELEEGGFQAAEARQWTTNSTWPMSISSRPGAFSDAMNWRIDAGVLDDDEDDDDFDEESYSDDFIEDDDESVSGPAPLVIQLPRRHMTPLPPIPRTTASAPATMNPNGMVPSASQNLNNTSQPIFPLMSRAQNSNGLGSASHSRSASNGKPAISESRSASSLNFDLRELDEQSFSASRASSGFL